MHVKDPGGVIPEREARSIAARSMGVPIDAVQLSAETSGLRVYRTGEEDFGAVRAVDWEGGLRVQRSRALVRTAKASTAEDMLTLIWKQTAHTSVPGLFLIFERHVVDLSGVENLDQALALAASEVAALSPETAIALIAVPRDYTR
jgi:N-methylhydantoinase A